MNEYPAMIRMQGKKATVIGGGTVAERKIESLLNAEANVIVVSPEITNQIQDWQQTNRLTWLKKEFDPTDVVDAFVVIAATNNRNVNQQVTEAVNDFQLLNVVDNPMASNFIVPSTFQQGQLTIAVSTSGASPGLAKKIKTELMATYDDTYSNYLDFLQNCRTEVKQTIKDPLKRRQILNQLLDEVFIELTRAGRLTERHQRFLSLLAESREQYGLNLNMNVLE